MPNYNKFDEANEILKAIASDPNSASYERWVNTLNELPQDEREKATGEFQRMAGREPKYADAYHNWGAALAGQKKYQEAIEQYQKATEIDPNYARAYNNWGLALAELGRYDEATEQYGKATHIDPNYLHACYNWGLALAEQRKYGEAIEQYRNATQIDPNYVHAYNSWGLALAEHRLGHAVPQRPMQVHAGEAEILEGQRAELRQRLVRAHRPSRDRLQQGPYFFPIHLRASLALPLRKPCRSSVTYR